MSRYAVRIGSALALLMLQLLAPAFAAGDDRAAFTFEGKQIVFAHLPAQPGGRAVAIDDPGLLALFAAIGATATYQPGQRYVLVTTAEPVVIRFAIGDRRYDVGPVTENAAFAPFLVDGHAYVPFDELIRALNLAPQGTVLQPELTSIDIQSVAGGSKLIAHAGMPLQAKIISDTPDKVAIAFDGVGSPLPPTRTLPAGPVRRIDIHTEGVVTHPSTIVTLYLAPGTTHSAAGTDDQRDFTIGFNGAPAAQPIAAAEPATEPEVQATPLASPQPQVPVGGAAVTAVQAQAQTDSFVVRIAVSGNAAYEWHRLRSPDNRFWIDIHGAQLSMPPSDQPGNDLVTAVRARQESGDTVRVALSLSGFNALDVTPDAAGITIVVHSVVADETSAVRSGSGNVGNAAVAYATPVPSGDQWKFGPRTAQTPYVAANPRLIVIDPGHGGSDWGSIRGDVVEKTLALDMSKRLRDILTARGWKVIMTREDDKDVYAPNDSASDELQARDDIANSNGARLLVSIHVNAFINSGPNGATVYYYKPSDFALAQAVDRRIASEGGIKDDGTVKDKLYVVHHASMPATLIETAFISNPDDRALLQSPEWRQKMAQAIADGISDYAGPPPPPGTVSGQ